MPDLTDADLEKWATACRGCESIEDDGFCCSGIRVPALIAALREARAERDEAEKRYVEQLERADAAVGDRDHRVAALQAERDALAAENERLREALRQWEWRDESYDQGETQITYCPACGALSRDGHMADCWMKAALAQSPQTGGDHE